jgi:hypothetical protein
MKFVDKILGLNKIDPFDKAPFLLPWYVDSHKPALKFANKTLTWSYVDKIKEEYVGIKTLNDNKNVLGLFNAYVYIQPSATGDRFCIWTRSNTGNIGFPTLTLNLYLTKDLKPFTDRDKSILELHADKGTFYLLNCLPKATISFQLNADKEAFKVDFPDDFKIFDEFITVSDIPNLYLNGKAEWNNTALVVIKPKDNWIFIYPQDWFNQDEKIDFGYQWITRAVRNTVNNNILGQGIRIDKFELDETNRQIKHWL